MTYTDKDFDKIDPDIVRAYVYTQERREQSSFSEQCAATQDIMDGFDVDFSVINKLKAEYFLYGPEGVQYLLDHHVSMGVNKVNPPNPTD